MKLIDKIVDTFEDYVIFILMIVMPVIVVIQIILRTVGGNLSWTEETVRYLFIWCIYIGTSRGVRKHGELSVDIVRNLVKDQTRARSIFDLVTAAACVFFSIVFVRYSIAVTQNLLTFPKYSPACHYNMIIVYMASVIGSILITFRYVKQLVICIIKVINPKYGVKEAEE